MSYINDSITFFNSLVDMYMKGILDIFIVHYMPYIENNMFIKIYNYCATILFRAVSYQQGAGTIGTSCGRKFESRRSTITSGLKIFSCATLCSIVFYTCDSFAFPSPHRVRTSSFWAPPCAFSR